MKYNRFEELPVWQAAVDFALLVFKFTNIVDLQGFGDTKNQLEQASLSISNNIAKGFERGSSAELIDFLYIARGSSGASRSMLAVVEQVPRFSNFKSEISNLKGRGENISKQLHGWIESLKKTRITKNKYLSKKDGETYEWEAGPTELDTDAFLPCRPGMLDRRALETVALKTVEEGS